MSPDARSGGDFLRATREVARKEFLQLLRTKRLLGVGIALVATLVLLTVVVPLTLFEAAELLEEGVAAQNFVMLFFLSGVFFLSGYFFIQLLPILLVADAVCSEWSNRTLFLLLSKPVPREAFVLGKFLGAGLTLAVVVGLLLAGTYVLLVPVLPGSPGGGEVAGFAGAVGILMLGVLAYAALALFFSAITRSSVASMLLAVVSWIIVLPLLAQLDLFIAMARHGTAAFSMGAAEAGIGWSQYLSPGGGMRTAETLLVGDDLVGFFRFFGGDAGDPVVAVAALLGHIVLWVGLAVVVVRRRNFE